jgi:deazaflavin-dependent oxidoreductase (nitroreductase family)
VSHQPPIGTDGFDNRIVKEFRANEGRVGGRLAGTPLILIHHLGAKSGAKRVTPLVCTTLGDGRYAIVASNGGSSTHPSWYFNLRANPRIEAELGTETFTVEAEELGGSARAELWPKLIAASPSLGEFESKASRQIPLMVLIRQDRPIDP